ncbi:hypothetical protein J4Q44_G00311960 [Coregonus suidteri]|uniref:Multifunctional methyltransferase subunit TRM112-like protein n=1 Tax=Coregonus suidteri TaxID=861788 RepID=A0AAN8L0R1_9TELE
MIPKLDWSALVQAADGLGHLQGSPAELVTDYEKNEDFLHKVEVQEGCLECPESGREFPISQGAPNMLLDEDEAWRRGVGGQENC